MARTRKRHTPAEVAAKLKLADRLLQEGRTTGDVAAALGVSKMTYHRWRAASGAGLLPSKIKASVSASALNAYATGESDGSGKQQTKHLGQLEAENALLRRALVDLLVEKLKLEERLRLLPAS